MLPLVKCSTCFYTILIEEETVSGQPMGWMSWRRLREPDVVFV